MYKFSQRSKDNLIGIHPDLVRLMDEAIKECPIDFTITDGLRTEAQQKTLYAQGRAKPGNIVTYKDGIRSKSNHQPKSDGYGYAVDLYPYYDGTVHVNDVNSLKTIAYHIKTTAKKMEISIQWGGDWKTLKDYPHFELIK